MSYPRQAQKHRLTLTLMMARRVLGGTDDGRSNHQIGLIICARCERATQSGVSVEPAVVEAACCDAQLLGRVEQAKPARAKQSIPPATRRMVIARQERRCAVPGCSHGAFLDLHHTKPRSEGGGHHPDHLVALCPTHHMRAHEGRLIVRGTFASGFTFEHADGRSYGSPCFDAGQAEAFAQGFATLRSLGFKESEAHLIIDATRPHVGADVRMPSCCASSCAARRAACAKRVWRTSGSSRERTQGIGQLCSGAASA